MRYFFFFFIICIAACNRKVKLAETVRPQQLPKQDNETDIAIERPILKEMPLDKTELIYYGKTSCYGSCPVYFVQFFSDGSIIYNGIKHVEKIGQIKSKVNTNQLFEMIHTLDQKQFFKLAESYPLNGQHISELPNTIIRVNNREMIHTVNNNYDAPNAFYEIENRILAFLEQNLISKRFK